MEPRGLFGVVMPLWRFNRLPVDEAKGLLRTCLDLDRWVHAVADARPYRGVDDLLEVARDAAFPFTPAELEAALAFVPVASVVPAPCDDEPLHRTQLREHLDAGVRHYQRRFGRAFLIRRDGRNDAQILVQLWERLGHDIEAEDHVLAQQVREITLASLVRMISE